MVCWWLLMVHSGSRISGNMFNQDDDTSTIVAPGSLTASLAAGPRYQHRLGFFSPRYHRSWSALGTSRTHDNDSVGNGSSATICHALWVLHVSDPAGAAGGAYLWADRTAGGWLGAPLLDPSNWPFSTSSWPSFLLGLLLSLLSLPSLWTVIHHHLRSRRIYWPLWSRRRSNSNRWRIWICRDLSSAEERSSNWNSWWVSWLISRQSWWEARWEDFAAVALGTSPNPHRLLTQGCPSKFGRNGRRPMGMPWIRWRLPHAGWLCFQTPT